MWGRGMASRWMGALSAFAGTLPLVACGVLEAQEDSALLTVGVGFRSEYFASRDRLASPRRHDGSGLSQLGFEISAQTRGAHHSFEFWMGSLPLTADDGFSYVTSRGETRTPKSEVALGDASYTHLRRVGVSAWWLGASASLSVTHGEYEFGSGAAESFLYLASLNAVGERRVDLGKERTLRLSLRVPLIGWTARPTFTTVDEARLKASGDFRHRMEGGEVTGPGDTRALWGRATYELQLNRHFVALGSLRFGVVRSSVGERFTAVRGGLDLGGALRWGGGDR